MGWSESNLFWPSGTLASDSDSILIRPEHVGMTYVGLRIFTLTPGQHRVIDTGEDEAILLPLTGSCQVQAGGRVMELSGRRSVFDAISDYAYLPIGCEVAISSAEGGEFAMPTARATRRLEPAYGPSDGVEIEIRGAGAASRQINNFFAPHASRADKLISVEVLTPAGNFSSYPPHKHDVFDAGTGEAMVEEIYYFRIDGADGYGLYRQYTADGEFAITSVVHDGDVFLVPKGYHGPSVAVPGHHMYFLNVLAGPAAERTMSYSDDPAQHWVRDSWRDQKPDGRLPMALPARRL